MSKLAKVMAIETEREDCVTCLGTGIGQNGDPATSRCWRCSGRGYIKNEMVPRKNWRDDERFTYRNAFDMLGEPLPWYIEVCRDQAERAMCGEDEWQLKETVKKGE